ncbi:uncharacterized protein PV07_04298 [Cladophialophora immunda]|uniref:Extracellular mutant protein 11 C-terminal domain-containing protein n=1 Tax=Cladophialophora immunda TaxID=569365 RepID=A0A0D2CS24_9EURO|nr:uncharacterized protein PV07_04298 [Cladophialophora immunda]KIW32775.1 hypothetical protein PV07_04298 [Cladophialophora immunda]OQU95345.1 hypothetical protein CLAIMM_01567 isoform 1 [Cladophialophora immunda]OQU95346.1 hypothetical protein CLAIMM_01567 isoform 2 [Cladophialophora immunda]
MPLVNDKMNAKQYIQNRESVSHQGRPEKRSLTPQPNSGRERSQQRQDEARRRVQQGSHGKENSEAISRRDAAKLKLDVPNTLTISSSKHAQPAGHGAAPEPAVAQPNIFARPAPSIERHHNAFDDTQSIHFDDSMSVADEKTGRTKPSFSFNHGGSMPPLWNNDLPVHPPAHHLEGSKLLFGERERIPGLPADWQAQSDAERLRRGFDAVHGARFSHNIDHAKYGKVDHEEGSDQDGDIDEGTSIVENTPSRTRMGPVAKTTSKPGKEKAKRSHRPEELGSRPSPNHRKSLSDVAPAVVVEPSSRQQINRFNVYKSLETDPETTLPDSLRQTIQIPQPHASLVHPPAFSSKMSSLHESSSDEEQPLAATTSESPRLGSKRHRSELDLDFELEVLKGKTMADLDAIPFTVDPRWSAPDPAVDANGTPMTLPAKLTNLTKMRPEDQRNLFKSLTDAEREQTAEWFVEKFKADMHRLMAVRLERRKIALRFELEVKKRERQVEVKRGDVDEELAGLKKGGGELIRGKSPAK